MPVIKNIILDWSGTLVDDFNPVLEATNEIFRQYNKPPFTAEEFREKFYLPFTEFYQEYLPEATMVQLDHYYHTAFKLLQENIGMLPHAFEFLDYCRDRGFNLFLLSTIHAEHFDVQGTRLGIKGYFRQAYVQAVNKKEVILRLLAEHNLEPKETMFIGDMQHDIDTARHGGVTGCAVLTGYDSLEKLKASEPDLLFQDLSGVRTYLEHHREEPLPPPIGTVGALIYDETGKVLMIQTYKWSNLWGIPGGKIKPGEPSEEALRREILEETGLEAADLRFVMIQDCIYSPEFYKPAHFLLLNYTALAPGDAPPVTLNDEAFAYQWVTVEEALQMPLNTPTRTLIEKVMSGG